MRQVTQPSGVHFVGSIPLANAGEVFTTISERLGDRVHRIPDGETGPRNQWIGWQLEVLAKHPDLEAVPAGPGSLSDQTRLRIRPGVDIDGLELHELGYASVAIESYQTFARQRAEGMIADHVRFQVSLPTPLAV